MVHLARYRDSLTGRYHHAQFADQLGSEEASDAMRITHELLWEGWVLGSLEQQHADLILYLRDLSTHSEQFLALFANPITVNSFAPRCANELEQARFMRNLRLLLTLARNSCAVTALDAGADLPQRSADPVWEHAVRHVHERHSDPRLSLQSMSSDLNMSSRDLARIFKEQTGKTFRQYLRHFRIQRAADLLSTSGQGVKAISAMVGYLDRSHFVRSFHQTTGHTPAEYQRNLHKVIIYEAIDVAE